MEKQVPWEDHNQKNKHQRHYEKGVGRASKQERMSQGVPILLKANITSGEKDDRLTAFGNHATAHGGGTHVRTAYSGGAWPWLQSSQQLQDTPQCQDVSSPIEHVHHEAELTSCTQILQSETRGAQVWSS